MEIGSDSREPRAEEVARAPNPFPFDLSGPLPTRVEPTIRERVHAYDLIRGVAILGILLANIPYFAGPAFSEMVSMTSSATGIDANVSAVTTALVAGKFRSSLATLFGIGMWLQYEKRSQILGNWPLRYLKRMLILAFFGLVHGILIWPGDILFIYAVSATLTCFFVGFSERVHRWIIGSAAVFGALVGIGLFVAGLFVQDFDLGDSGKLFGITAERELAAFAHGSYFDQLAIRATLFFASASSLIVLFPSLAGLFFLGVSLAQHRTLANPSAHPRARKIILLLGFGIALPFSLMIGWLTWNKPAVLLETSVELFFGPLLAVGLVMLLAIWVESGWLKGIQRAVAKVGRTAFSNYILQSLLCTFIFYSWGLGWFGELDRLEMLAVVPIVWTINLLFAHFWLKKYTMGPLEWLWRSWTEGKRLEM